MRSSVSKEKKNKLRILLLLTLVNILKSTFKCIVPSYKVLLLHLSLLQRSRGWSLEYSPLWGPTSPTRCCLPLLQGTPWALLQGGASNANISPWPGQAAVRDACGSLASLSLGHPYPCFSPNLKGSRVSVAVCLCSDSVFVPAGAAWGSLCLGELHEDTDLTCLSTIRRLQCQQSTWHTAGAQTIPVEPVDEASQDSSLRSAQDCDLREHGLLLAEARGKGTEHFLGSQRKAKAT